MWLTYRAKPHRVQLCHRQCKGYRRQPTESCLPLKDMRSLHSRYTLVQTSALTGTCKGVLHTSAQQQLARATTVLQHNTHIHYVYTADGADWSCDHPGYPHTPYGTKHPGLVPPWCHFMERRLLLQQQQQFMQSPQALCAHIFAAHQHAHHPQDT